MKKAVICVMAAILLLAGVVPVNAHAKTGAREKTFTGVNNKKSNKKNKRVLKLTPNDWISLLNGISGSGLTVKNGTLSKKQKKALKKAMDAYWTDTNVYGFIALNTKTGRTISYNADFSTSSMSTIKAPFLVSLCVCGAKGVSDHKWEIQRILQYSDNACYDAMVQQYGVGYVSAFLQSAGVYAGFDSGGYTGYSTRSLAKIWCRIKQALELNRGDIKLIKKNLLFHTRGVKKAFQDYYKKGWWYMSQGIVSVLNCGGCGKDWVYAVMSHPRDARILPEKNQDRLIAALYYAVH